VTKLKKKELATVLSFLPSNTTSTTTKKKSEKGEHIFEPRLSQILTSSMHDAKKKISKES